MYNKRLYGILYKEYLNHYAEKTRDPDFLIANTYMNRFYNDEFTLRSLNKTFGHHPKKLVRIVLGLVPT